MKLAFISLRRRTVMAAALFGLFLASICGALSLMFWQSSPISVSLERYERSGASNYALLAVSNSSRKRFYFTTYNTLPEGTAQHFVTIHSTNGWTKPEEVKPAMSGSGIFYRFADTLEPKGKATLKVPVDTTSRQIAIPFYPHIEKRTPLLEFLLRLRFKLRSMFGLPIQPHMLVWCPTELSRAVENKKP
jgi:hypothetical protein